MTDRLFFSHEEYAKLQAFVIERISALARDKGGEYAGDHNRLENFVRNAVTLELQPEQVWAVYMNKHIDAINQYVQDMQTGKERVRSEPIPERMLDVIVYMILGMGMYQARVNSMNTMEVSGGGGGGGKLDTVRTHR